LGWLGGKQTLVEGLFVGGVSGGIIGYIYGIVTAANTVVYSNFSKLIQIGPEDWEIVAPD
tara:strand:+ start:172 stop:351 length:180 start_codon:yes stop_codon:yes gene_type:complete